MASDLRSTPFSPHARPERATPPTSPSGPTSGSGRAAPRPRLPKGNMHILLVEDDPAVRGVVKRVLTRMGHTVTPCAGPDDVEGCEGFDLALVDLNLGESEGDGLRLLLRLRDRWPQAGFILTSGARPSLPRPDEGGPHFLRKPFSRHELAELIEDLQGLG